MVEAWKPQGRWAEQLWSSVSRPLEQHSSLTAWILTVNTVIIVIIIIVITRCTCAIGIVVLTRRCGALCRRVQ